MRKTDGDIKRKLLWKAGAYQLPTAGASYFKDQPAEKQNEFLEQIEVAVSGEPVLLFTRPTGEWTVICTRQVIGYDRHRLDKLDLADMREMSPLGLLPLQEQAKPVRLITNKTELFRLVILDVDDRPYSFNAEAGGDFFAMWNILLMVKRLLAV